MLLRFKNIPLPDSKRVYVRLRKVGRRLQVLLAPFAELFRLLGRQWPVSLVWLGLSFCCLLPGLAEQQTSEALLEYANAAESAGVLWGRTMITAAISVMLGEVLAHWTARLLDASRHRWFGSEATARRLTAFNRWFPVLALAVAFWTLQDSATGWFYPYRAIAILLAFARPACLAIIYLASLPLRSAAFATAPSVPHWMAARRPYLAALTSAACLVVIFGTADKDHIAGLPVSSVALAQFLGPLNLLLLFFAIFVSIASMLILSGRFLRLPLTALVIFCAIVFSWLDLNDNHSIRTAEETADDKPADVQAAFDRWISQRPDRNRFDGDYPVVLVSAEGGGIRAAFFTAVTLARIVDRCPPLAQHIFAISGVSGGAVGAAVFAAALEAVPPSSTDRKCDLAAPVRPVYENAVSSVLEDDHLSPLLARMLFSDAFQQILPFPVHSFDRQLGLEFSLEQSFRRIFGRDLMVHSLYNLQPSAAKISIPYLLLNSTEVDGGRRFVMTPLYLRTEEFNGVEDWHWLDWKHGPQLSTAAANSA